MSFALGNGKSDLLLEVEKIIWDALFEMTTVLRDPELILIELVNSKIPWTTLGSSSLPDSERRWFDLSFDLSKPQFDSAPSIPRLIEDAMDVRPDCGAIPVPSVRESDVGSNAVSKLNPVGLDVSHNSQVSASVELQNAMDMSVRVTEDPMDTEQDFQDASEIDEDAEGEEDPLHLNDQDAEETQTGANALPGQLKNPVHFPSPAVPSRSSNRLKEKIESMMSSESSEQQPPRKRKRTGTLKRNDVSEHTHSPSPEPELSLRGTPGYRLMVAGSKPSMPIDVDALDALKQRFPLALEQVCVYITTQ